MRSLLLILFLAIGTPLYAKLEWSQKEIQLPCHEGDKVLQARFEFVNKGEETVTIRSVKTSCGCTEAGTAQKTYKPGEVGEIVVDFDVGDRLGHQKKTITVLTDDPEDSFHLLKFATYIPVIATIRPRILLWEKGEPRKPKKIRILPEENRIIRKVQLIRPTENFEFEISQVEGQWQLIVTPKESLHVTTHGTVEVSITTKGGAVKTQRIFLKRFISGG